MRCIVSLLGLALCCSATLAEDKVFSGPQAGEPITPFKVLQITGPEELQEVQIISEEEKRPTLLVFLHEITEPALGLTITLEWYAHKHKDLASHFVLLTADRAKTEAQTKRWWRRPFYAAAPMNISLDGPEGPGRYGLNRKLAMTVLVAKENKVTANFVLKAPNNTDAAKILAAVAKVLDQKPPSVDKLRTELRADRQKRREKARRELPVYKLAPNPTLGKLMVNLLHREGIDAAYAKKVAGQMREWAGDDAEKKAALAKYCQDVLKKFDWSEHAAKVVKMLTSK